MTFSFPMNFEKCTLILTAMIFTVIKFFSYGLQFSKTIKFENVFHAETHLRSFRASLEFHSQNLLTPELKV